MQGAKKALIKHGYAKLTTNRIAAAAGVSVGSLYQYFPDKNAILIRMIREYADGMQERMQATILANLSSDPEQIVTVVIDSMVDAFAAEKDLMAVIVGEVPYHGGWQS